MEGEVGESVIFMCSSLNSHVQVQKLFFFFFLPKVPMSNFPGKRVGTILGNPVLIIHVRCKKLLQKHIDGGVYGREPAPL